jgi:hypothetical protein
MSETPYEVIAGPLEVWVAPVGETFPDVNDAPTGNWTKVGTSGVRSISEDGVTVSHPQKKSCTSLSLSSTSRPRNTLVRSTGTPWKPWPPGWAHRATRSWA